MSGIIEILVFFVTILGILYLWLKYHYSYWKRHNITYIAPTLLFGNMQDIVFLRNSAAESFQDLYNHESAKNEPFVGMHVFHQPALLIRDLELIRRILIRDFNKFSNRLSACDPHTDPLGGNVLFFLKNPLWKQMRTKLTPVFSSGKMKQLFALLDKEIKMSGIIEILVFFVTILGILYLWLKYHYSYWKRHNITYIAPTLLFGNMQDIVFLRNSAAESFQDLYNHESAKNEPFVGMHVFHQPALLIRDLELIRRILIRDFNKFSNRLSACDPHTDPLGGNVLFFLKNPLWKQMRTKLTPVFSSGKMKQLFALLDKSGKDLDQYICKLYQKSGKKTLTLEVKDTAALYTTDVITSSVFGLEANSFENEKAEFRRFGRAAFDFSLLRAIEFIAFFFLPQAVAFFKFKFFSKKAEDFLRNTVKYVITEREKSGKVRNDMIDILINLKNSPKDDKNNIKFDGDVLYAQPVNFFIAGFETSSSAMSFALYELANNMEYQERLRDEIKEVLQNNNGELTYDIVMNMRYLNMVLQETLRLYPPLPFLDRVCTLSKDESVYSLDPFSDYSIPNGMPVFIPIYAIQRDPQYFPNPNTFDPERFGPKNKGNVDPMTNIPFGTGPHNCIGERFGLMSAKIGLINFLKNYYVKPSKSSRQTMKLEKKALIIQSEGGIYCDIVKDPLIK